MEALHYNLAGRLQIAYGMEVNPGIVGLGATALNTIRAANAQIPLMEMPTAVKGFWPRGVGAPGFGWAIGGTLQAGQVSPTGNTGVWGGFSWDDGTVWA
jgi:hypothetical protein